jgi:hypothetical protein
LFFFWFCFHKISDPVSLISLYSDCVTKRKKKTHWRLNPSPVNMSRFEIFQFFGFPPFYFILLFFCPIFSPICLFIFSSKFPVVKKKRKTDYEKNCRSSIVSLSRLHLIKFSLDFSIRLFCYFVLFPSIFVFIFFFLMRELEKKTLKKEKKFRRKKT